MKSLTRFVILLAAFVLAFIQTPAARAQTYLLALDSGADRVILINADDFTVVDPNFIVDANGSPFDWDLPKGIAQVGNEIWIADQNRDSVYCFTASIPSNYIRTITGQLDNIRGLGKVGDRVYVSNAGTGNGAPGAAICVYDLAGNRITSFPGQGSPFDCIAFEGKVLMSDFSGYDLVLYNTDGTLDRIFHDFATGDQQAPQQLSVAPTGPAGAMEVWSAGFTSDDVVRYAADGSVVARYPAVGDQLRGIVALPNGSVVFTSATTVGYFTPPNPIATTILSGIVPQYITLFVPGVPGTTNPYVSGIGNPSPAQPGANILLTANVILGTTPASTGVIVTADLTAFGGSATQAFASQTATTHTYTLPVAANQAAGNYSVPLTVSDAQARTFTGSMTLTIIVGAPPGFVVEAEPNNTNETATPAPISPGQGVYGLTTGTSTTVAGLGSADNFLITTPAAPLGIYRHRMQITTTGTAGHVGTLRGFSQTAASGINLTSDAALQSSLSTTTPPRFNQWYGFGLQEQVAYRVTGVAATTSEYLSTLETTQITPNIASGNIVTGQVTISRDTGNTTCDYIVYDSNFNPVADVATEGTATITRTLNPGTYYMAISNANTANNLITPADATTRTGNVLRFPNAVANSSTTVGTNLNMKIDHAGGTVFLPASKSEAFEVVWHQFVVESPLVPVGVGTANPNPAISGNLTTLNVNVVPAVSPASTGLTVTADLSVFGGSATQVFTPAGGNAFQHALNLPLAIGGGPYLIAFTASDAQGRSSNSQIILVVIPGPQAGYVAEVEPNETKGNATIASIAPGGGVWGMTTGTATTAGAATSLDTFRITTPAAAPGIYRHRMVLSTSGTAGHTGSIRGLSQSAGVINGTSDSALQTSSTTTTPPRYNQWYGMGGPTEIYYRVTGGTTTTAEYTSTLETTSVTPTVIAESVYTGPISFGRDPLSTLTFDLHLFDQNFQAIVDASSEGVNSITRTLAPGTYYLAISNVNTATNQASPVDSSVRSGIVTDFPNVVANSNVTLTTLPMQILHPGGTIPLSVAKTEPYQVLFYQFTVLPTNVPVGFGTAVPFATEHGRSLTVQVTATPGENPPSTGMSVTADLTLFGLSATEALTDQGGFVFSRTFTVPVTVPVGIQTVNYTVSDAQARSSGSQFQIVVLERSWNELAEGGSDSGDLPGTALSVTGTGSLTYISGDNATDDVDMFRINICDPATFSAETETLFNLDTQIWLFRLDGTGIIHDDDSSPNGNHSLLPAGHALLTALTPGEYLLAFSRFNRDPRDAAHANLWSGTVTVAPTNNNPIAEWNTATAAGGPWRIKLTGACYITPPILSCNPADIVSVGQLPPPDGVLSADDFLAFFGAYFAGNTLADIVSVGGLPPPDGNVSADDFLGFLNFYFQGC